MSELFLYTSEDGITRLDLRVDGHTVWLTQLEIAELFQTTKQNVSLHAKNIFKERELHPEATVKESLTVAADGKRYKTMPKARQGKVFLVNAGQVFKKNGSKNFILPEASESIAA